MSRPRSKPAVPVVPFTARIPEPLYEQMRSRAFEERIPFNEMLSLSLAKHLNGAVEASPALGNLTVSERRTLLTCLDLLRNASGKDRIMFNAIIRWWQNKAN